MKLVIETGSGQHTTSHATCQARFRGGPFNGKFLYEVKEYQKKVEWDKRDPKERWATTEYDLPAGQMIEVIGKGGVGNHGSEKYSFHRVYMLDPEVEPIEIKIDVGLRTCLLVGRLAPVTDIDRALARSNKIDTKSGF